MVKRRNGEYVTQVLRPDGAPAPPPPPPPPPPTQYVYANSPPVVYQQPVREVVVYKDPPREVHHHISGQDCAICISQLHMHTLGTNLLSVTPKMPATMATIVAPSPLFAAHIFAHENGSSVCPTVSRRANDEANGRYVQHHYHMNQGQPPPPYSAISYSSIVDRYQPTIAQKNHMRYGYGASCGPLNVLLLQWTPRDKTLVHTTSRCEHAESERNTRRVQ